MHFYQKKNFVFVDLNMLNRHKIIVIEDLNDRKHYSNNNIYIQIKSPFDETFLR